MCTDKCIVACGSWICAPALWGGPVTRVSHPLMFWYCVLNNGCVVCPVTTGVKHQDSQNSFLAFLNAPTSALDQFDVSITEKIWLRAQQLKDSNPWLSILCSPLRCFLHAFIIYFSPVFIFVLSFVFLTSLPATQGFLFLILIFFNWVLGRCKFILVSWGVCACVCNSSCRSEHMN